MSEINEVNEKNEKGKMTAVEMGRKGGTTTKERYGMEYYHKIGEKAGNTIRRRLYWGKRLDEAGFTDEELREIISNKENNPS